jgi:hypothetical protein
MIGSPTLLLLGLLLLAVSILLLNWASSRNLKDVAIGAALGAAWTLLWKRRRPDIPEEFTTRVDEVRSQGTHLGKAKVVAGYAAKHFVAQVASLTGLVLFALGALLAALGIFWR